MLWINAEGNIQSNSREKQFTHRAKYNKITQRRKTPTYKGYIEIKCERCGVVVSNLIQICL